MPKRPNTPSLDTLEAAHGTEPPIAIPPGADVRVSFKAPVDPSTLINDSHYTDDIAALAAEETEDDVPLDPLTMFTSEWAAYEGATLRVTRLADPAARRIPGQTYNRPCLEVEALGDTPFDPVNLQSTLQLINGGSGGVFRLWIIGNDNRPIPGAFLNRIAIGDPPKHFNPTTQQTAYYQPSQPSPSQQREPSEVEKKFQAMQDRLLERAMARLLDPTEPQTHQQPSQPSLSDEDRLTLLLVREGGVLPKVVSRLTDLVGSPETATGKETWSEWLKRTGGTLLETHPEIGERITNTVANVITLVVNRLPGNPQQPHQQQQQAYSGGRVEPIRQPARLQAVPPPQSANPADSNEQEIEDATMVILEDLISLLSGTEPLAADNPIFVRLNKEYPIVFQQAVALIARYPLDLIISWIKEKSTLYASMFDSPVTGPHYRQRLTELKILCSQPVSEQSNATQNTKPQDNEHAT
jgi:hypothetical protein